MMLASTDFSVFRFFGTFSVYFGFCHTDFSTGFDYSYIAISVQHWIYRPSTNVSR